MKKRYMIVCMNNTLENGKNCDSFIVECYSIKTAVTLAKETINDRYKIEPYLWEIVSIIKTI